MTSREAEIQAREAAVERVADAIENHFPSYEEEGLYEGECLCGEKFATVEEHRAHWGRAAIAAYEGREVSE